MSEPYRDRHLSCPACHATLREFRSRQVCDACEGMMLTLEDLASGIHDLTSILPAFAFDHEAPGERACPHCREPMTRCRLRIGLEDDHEKPKPELDRCAQHGIWFDAEELAAVLEKVAGKGYGAGVGRKAGHARTALPGSQGWSAMFKKFGGHGGF